MRHKAAIALGCVLLALALSACGGTPQSTPAPTPDIEATVEARVAEERAAEATVEARAQTMAKAVVWGYRWGSAYAHTYSTYTEAAPAATAAPAEKEVVVEKEVIREVKVEVVVEKEVVKTVEVEKVVEKGVVREVAAKAEVVAIATPLPVWESVDKYLTPVVFNYLGVLLGDVLRIFAEADREGVEVVPPYWFGFVSQEYGNNTRLLDECIETGHSFDDVVFGLTLEYQALWETIKTQYHIDTSDWSDIGPVKFEVTSYTLIDDYTAEANITLTRDGSVLEVNTRVLGTHAWFQREGEEWFAVGPDNNYPRWCAALSELPLPTPTPTRTPIPIK